MVLTLYDVIVVGGGPSGSVAATFCKRFGLKTLLLEKKEMPRVKPCGGALSNKALSLLKQLKIPINANLIETRVHGVNIVKPSGKSFLIDAGRPIAALVLREKFDKFLFEISSNEGCDVVTKTKVVNLKYNKDSVTVYTDKGDSFASKIVIGADGVNTAIGKYSSLRKWHKDELGICIVMEPKVGKEIMDKFFNTRNFISIYLGCLPLGYAWIFPKKECASIGMGGLLGKVRHLKTKFTRFYKKFEFLRNISPSMNVALIPAGGFKRSLVCDRTLLVGDAAGFVDTFTGEGIFYALKSGYLAAKVVKNSFSSNKFDRRELRQYESLCYNEFERNLKASLFLAFKTQRYLGFLLSVIENDMNLQQCFSEVIEGKKGYCDLLRKLVLRSPLALANMMARNIFKLA